MPVKRSFKRNLNCKAMKSAYISRAPRDESWRVREERDEEEGEEGGGGWSGQPRVMKQECSSQSVPFHTYAYFWPTLRPRIFFLQSCHHSIKPTDRWTKIWTGGGTPPLTAVCPVAPHHVSRCYSTAAATQRVFANFAIHIPQL